MAEEERRRHILISGTARSEHFVSPSGGGADRRLPERNRIQHGRALLRQVRDISRSSSETIEEQKALGLDVGTGIYLEFESARTFELPVESLGDARRKIELLSVRTVGERSFATVFVPEGKLVHFENLISAYVEEDTKTGKPKNQKVVASIDEIRQAAIKALWTDDPGVYPRRDNEAIWWEVWLRTEGDRNAYVRLFREHGQQIGLEIPRREVRFVERTVVAARGTARQLAQSVRLLNCIAELRRVKETADFFRGLAAAEQRAWVDEALGRIRWPRRNAPAVCVLDTGVNREHPLLAPALDEADLQSNNPAWDAADEAGHGTEVAGLSLLGDLTEPLAAQGRIDVPHRLESVKILRRDGDNQGELYGDITREAIARAEVAAPNRNRAVCLAVSAKDSRDRGYPSQWSAAVDALCSGSEDDRRRFIAVAAGNVPRDQWEHHPASNETDGIHDPGQAWNALTVGAYTEKDHIDPAEYPGFTALVEHGDLGPSSCTSVTWERQWPLKPDVVFEGGNAAKDPQGGVDTLTSLDLLTTHFEPANRMFTEVGDTSASVALASRMAATIQAAYPDLWPETVRALMVHSARWTPTMLRKYLPRRPTKAHIAKLVRRCGFGVPSPDRALWSLSNALTLIAQDEVQPFDKVEGDVKTRDMNLHAIPWPVDVLESLGEAEVQMRVTLSYFVEPNPASRGWTRRYRYESHGLRFAVKHPAETLRNFKLRVNQHIRDEEDDKPTGINDDGWLIGPTYRHLGSLHSDVWTGTAAELAQRGYLAVYPALGWWRERKQLERWSKKARYALLVSIEAPSVETDLYAAVKALIRTPVAVGVRAR